MLADVSSDKQQSDWSSSFTYSGTNSSGVVNWSFTGDQSLDWTHRLLVVEHSAHFPDGSNGLEDYEHVVRGVITLQNDAGTLDVDLPAAWDGDDLSLVLIHEWRAPAIVDPVPEEDDGFLPGFLAPVGLIALGGAAWARKD